MAVHPMAERRVLYEIPGGGRPFQVKRDLAFPGADGDEVRYDLYRPDGGPAPVVVLVLGYPDPGMARVLGVLFRRMGWSESWARLCAASGLAVAVPSNREPAADLDALLRFLGEHAGALGIDAGRYALLASSGHGPLALSRLAAQGPRPRCVAALYPYLMDLDELTGVAEAAATFKFATPLAGRGIDALDLSVPLMLVRAGADEMPGLIATFDRFVARASDARAALTLLDCPGAPHAFDITVPGDDTSRAVEAVLQFLVGRLRS